MAKIRVTLLFDSELFDNMTAAAACRKLRSLVAMFPEPDDIPDPEGGKIRDDTGAVLGVWKVSEI